jgi:UDPglucose 6-dehydrogenase
MIKIGIIGNGFVGKATNQLKCEDIEIVAYDINPDFCHPKDLKLVDLNECEIVFISVPTPMSTDGSCHLGIVKSVLDDLVKIEYKGFIILRSTVPVGTSDELKCYFMPEFLTEKNYVNDFINNKDWIFGLMGLDAEKDTLFKNKIDELFESAFQNERIKYNTIHFLTNKEAEMVKMFRNCFLATKVSFCNEINEFCEKLNINYENVRKVAANDGRILHSHTTVPGHDGKKGFGGTCFPKDTSSLKYEMKKMGMKPYVLEAIIERNDKIDRTEKDWANDKGRAVIDDKQFIDFKSYFSYFFSHRIWCLK